MSGRRLDHRCIALVRENGRLRMCGAPRYRRHRRVARSSPDARPELRLLCCEHSISVRNQRGIFGGLGISPHYFGYRWQALEQVPEFAR